MRVSVHNGEHQTDLVDYTLARGLKENRLPLLL